MNLRQDKSWWLDTYQSRDGVELKLEADLDGFFRVVAWSQLVVVAGEDGVIKTVLWCVVVEILGSHCCNGISVNMSGNCSKT